MFHFRSTHEAQHQILNSRHLTSKSSISGILRPDIQPADLMWLTPEPNPLTSHKKARSKLFLITPGDSEGLLVAGCVRFTTTRVSGSSGRECSVAGVGPPCYLLLLDSATAKLPARPSEPRSNCRREHSLLPHAHMYRQTDRQTLTLVALLCCVIVKPTLSP